MKTQESKDQDGFSVVSDNITVNQVFSDKKPQRKWSIALLSTIAGIFATLFVAWYQLQVGEDQIYAAAIEREKAVVQDMVHIVEEHVININSLDIPRLARLIDIRSREENLNNTISTLQVIQKAEFNIINVSAKPTAP